MTLEEIIERILSIRRDMAKEDVLRLIEEKEARARGYLTRESIARIVASELGVELEGEPLHYGMSIKNLVSGLNDVTITGRVISVSPIRHFTRRDGREGSLRRLRVADRSGEINVILWDDKAENPEVNEDLVGRIVRFSHGYVRERMGGELELNIGSRGSIEISPPDVREEDYPRLNSFLKGIGEISREDYRVNTAGTVLAIHPITTFKRQDGTEGKNCRLELGDETGMVTVVFWDEKAEAIRDVKPGTRLRVMGARVRERVDGSLELHVDSSSNVAAIKGEYKTMKIGELKPGMRSLNILAKVVETGRLRTVKRRAGESRLFTLLIGDETGLIQMNLWNERADEYSKIKRGDIVMVKGAYTRERFGRPILSLEEHGEIVINPNLEGSLKPPTYKERLTRISELKSGMGLVTVKGEITTMPLLREVTTTRGDKVKMASFEISDGTGRVEVSLWRDPAELVGAIPVGTKIKIKNVYVTRDPDGRVRLSSGALTSLEGADIKSS